MSPHTYGMFTEKCQLYAKRLFWEGLCRRCKVRVMLVLTLLTLCWMEERPLLSAGDWGDSCQEEKLNISVSQLPTINTTIPVCLCVALCCSALAHRDPFASRRLRHVWSGRSDRRRGENHQQQAQDQREGGKSIAAVGLSFCLERLKSLNTWTESSAVKARTLRDCVRILDGSGFLQWLYKV